MTEGQIVITGTNGKTVDHITCHKCKNSGQYANKCPMNQNGEGSTKEKKEEVSTHVLYQSHLTSDEDSFNHIPLTTSTAILDHE